MIITNYWDPIRSMLYVLEVTLHICLEILIIIVFYISKLFFTKLSITHLFLK